MSEQRDSVVDQLMADVREEVAQRHRERGNGTAHPASASGRPSPLAQARQTQAVGSTGATGDPRGDPQRARHHLRDLTPYYGQEFVTQAFRAVMLREPDDEGMRHYGALLERGWSRVEVIGRMRFSKEGRRKHVRIVGLLPPLALRLSLRIPVLGYLLALIVALLQLPGRLRALERFEHRAMDDHAPKIVVDQLQAVVDRLPALEARIAQVQGQSERAQNLAAKLAAMESRQSQADQTHSQALQGHSQALQEQMARVMDLGKRLAGIDAQHSEALLGHLNQLKEISGRVQAVSDQVGEMDFRQVQALAHNTERLSETSNALDERAIVLERRMDETMHQVDGVSSRMNEVVTGLGDQMDRALGTLTRLKRDFILQERRCGLLLDEARKRMPAPLDSEQLAVFDNAAKHLLDAMYVNFEDDFRGTREDIRGRFAVYLPLLDQAEVGKDGRPILDIGCGRGEWLELLRDNQYEARGVDNNRIMVEACRELGLELTESDALEHLRSLPDGSLGAVTGFHIIEHLPFDMVVALYDECLRLLVPGGLVIFETPNPANLQVGACNFYLDPSHRNPLPSQMVAFTAEARGFTRVQVMGLHPLPQYETVQPEQDELMTRLRELLYGPQDYAVVGYRP